MPEFGVIRLWWMFRHYGNDTIMPAIVVLAETGAETMKRRAFLQSLAFNGVAFQLAASSLSSSRVFAQSKIDTPPFLVVRQGQLPIIITAPHGGRDSVPGAALREKGVPFRVVTVRDENTLELAQKLASALESRLGRAPHLIAAQFERKYIDANRPAAEAYEPPGAGSTREIYSAYHGAIASAHAQVRRQFGRGLLIDLHGQGQDAGTLFRGTQNGATVRQLLGKAGMNGLTGPQSLFGVLAAKGYPVFPGIGSSERENPAYNGGHTVRTYGGGAVDAIQLEFGLSARSGFALGSTAADLADAIVVHARAHLGVK
jgi:N-formylglutamate amidohydrolase